MSQELTKEQIEQFRVVFDRFDKDGGGTIDTEELGAAMYSLGSNPTKLELQDMVESVDKDGSGTIDFKEFLSMMANKLSDADTVDDLVEALGLFDTRRTGSVPASVLRHALLSIGEKMSEEEVQFVFSQLPRNEQGKFVSEEIAQILLS
mmetsp:Transcript_9939/g.17429  ORF Transcript_9939/g.17429 Transcript_9939/m.17429 type:complete len:149 (-) Transcript_9939:103-549(-)